MNQMQEETEFFENSPVEAQAAEELPPRRLTYTPSTVAHILNELRKVVVGQDEVIEQILVAVLAEGHALLEGVPGTAKTLTVKTPQSSPRKG